MRFKVSSRGLSNLTSSFRILMLRCGGKPVLCASSNWLICCTEEHFRSFSLKRISPYLLVVADVVGFVDTKRRVRKARLSIFVGCVLFRRVSGRNHHIKMCGILVGFRGVDNDAIYESGRAMIRRRGPDHACESKLDDSQFISSLFASCLFLQGETPQPVQDAKFVLCFNGELYCDAIPSGVSDTQFLFDKLASLANNELRTEFLSTMEGEWALAFYCMQTRTLLFGRDGLGRRSLMIAHSNNNIQCISSTAIPGTETMWRWTELACSCMYQLSESEVYLIKRLPRSNNRRRNIFPEIAANTLPTWKRFLFALDNATRRRLHEDTLRGNSKAAILFSGGIDSVLLAVCAHRVLPPEQSIQLINVSFQANEAPDRIAAEQSLLELERAFPQRTFILIRVDATLEQVKHEESAIVNHMFPKQTVMDFNLSCVLWFGSLHCSSARVLLSGIGADELCGGYSRHKQKYKTEGLLGLRRELEMDVGRLWLRNFGRDDRAVAAHGKELRMPFVDSQIMQVVRTSPIDDLMSFDGGSGAGDKLVLRRIMHELGMGETAERVKRAAQFGSRMAKLIRPEAHGTDEYLLGSTLSL